MNRMLTEGDLRDAIGLTYAAGNIGRYLGLLDLEQLREQVGTVGRTRVFLSYSHRDRHWRDRVRVHLQPLVRDRDVDDWADDRIPTGADWEAEIDSAIESARVALLLVSANFMASDFIQEKELPKLLATAQRDGLRLLIIVIGACAYDEHAELRRYQAVHDVSRPLNQLQEGEQDEILNHLRREVQRCLTTPNREKT